ncbi:MAG: hypothetical protein HRU26_03810, partial [Psychroserpens sp.]|nr:hypothetical protein [Psychroserpens sp.]
KDKVKIDAYDHKYYKHFLSISKLFFSDFNEFPSLPVKDRIFKLKLKYKSFRKFLDQIIKQFRFIKAIFTTRIWEFIKNSSYRRAIATEYRKKLGF